MIRQFLEAAAAAGPNRASRNVALRGQAKTIDKNMMGPGPSRTHPGSPAGLRAASRLHMEMQGEGFGKYIRKTDAIYTSMWLEQPQAMMSRTTTMADYRQFRRREIDLDGELAGLL